MQSSAFAEDREGRAYRFDRQLIGRDSIGMKVFGSLEVHLNGVELSALAELLTKELPPGWTRNRDDEQFMAKFFEQNSYGFSYRPQDASDHPIAASLLLSKRHTEDSAYVAAITALDKYERTLEEYNEVLNAFDALLTPVAESLGLRIDRADQDPEPEDLVGTEAADALRTFAATAEKCHRATNPEDRQRLNHFIVLYHASGGELTINFLREFLRLAGWDDASAHHLADQVQRGRDLLKQYQEER